LSIDDLKLNYASTISDMDSLTKYAAALSAVVADQTCASLQTNARGLATAVGDIATMTKAPAAAAAAGPISQIVAAAGCAAINDVQLRILKASTDAANPSIQILVPLIAAKYNELYMTALTEAHTQLLSSMTDYLTAQNSYQKSKSPLDLDKEKSSLTKAISLAAAIDKAKSNPPGPVVLKVATLHQNLTSDLKSPTVNLKRVLNDAQAFVTEAASVASAADALTKANSKVSK
jgi:hypothetical protein